MRGTAIARLWWLGQVESFCFWLWGKAQDFSARRKLDADRLAAKRTQLRRKLGLLDQGFLFTDEKDHPPF